MVQVSNVNDTPLDVILMINVAAKLTLILFDPKLSGKYYPIRCNLVM